MRRQLHAEWTKLRTLAGTGRLLLALVVLPVVAGVTAAALVSCTPADCDHDPARISLFGVHAGQLIVVILAVTMVSGEYGTGMIRTTLAAMPDRIGVLTAKAAVLTGLTLAAGSVAVPVSALAGRHLLAESGFAAGQLAHLGGRPVFGSVLYLALIGLFSLGVATVVRDSAVAVGVVLGLCYLLPAVSLVVPDRDLAEILWQISPMNAGLAVQATTHLSSLPLGPWAGLGVLAAWAAAALLGGGLLLRARDAS